MKGAISTFSETIGNYIRKGSLGDNTVEVRVDSVVTLWMLCPITKQYGYKVSAMAHSLTGNSNALAAVSG